MLSIILKPIVVNWGTILGIPGENEESRENISQDR
jgi:hypothetical protein